jgi:hypothetical protein
MTREIADGVPLENPGALRLETTMFGRSVIASSYPPSPVPP